jgi:hypothetical protein
MSSDELRKKARLIDRLVSDVAKHYARYAEAYPLRFASARYSRAFAKLGGFQEVMEELEADGSLIVEWQRSGKRLLYPPIGDQLKARGPSAKIARIA